MNIDPVLLEVSEDGIKVRFVGGRHPKDGEGVVVLLPPHLETKDAVLAAVLQDLVEHLRQEERIDYVPLELDVLIGAQSASAQ